MRHAQRQEPVGLRKSKRKSGCARTDFAQLWPIRRDFPCVRPDRL